MIATTKPDGRADLETLRRILLADERDHIVTLRRALMALDGRVGDDDRFRDTMTKSLVAAFRAAEIAQHRELAEALSPLVLAGIRREIVESRDLMVEALYPITWRLVAAAVAHALRNVVAEVNAKLDAVVAPLNWRGRAKSLLTGRPSAEVILSEAAGFQLERLLLIERSSGVLLGTWTARETEAGPDTQTALMGGLLSAIVGFSCDAFEGDGHDLRSLDLGGRAVMLRSSARRIVAAVGQGVVDRELEARTDRAFLNLLETGSEADDEATSRALLGSLASALAAPAAPARTKALPVPLLIAATMLIAALGYWGAVSFEARRSEQRLDAALDSLGETIGSNGGALTLTREASTRTVKAVGFLPTEATRRDLQAAIARQLPGYRLDAQIVTATGGPASLDVRMGLIAADRSASADPAFRHESDAGSAGTKETIEQQVSRQALANSERMGALESAVAGLRLDTENRLKSTEAVVASQIERVRTGADQTRGLIDDPRRYLTLALSGYAVFFAEGAEYRSATDAARDLDAVALLLKEKREPRIRLIGHGDDLGSRPADLTVARARAEKVASDLVERGIDPARLVLAARDGSQEIVETQGIGSPNRRVTFEPVYVGE